MTRQTFPTTLHIERLSVITPRRVSYYWNGFAHEATSNSACSLLLRSRNGDGNVLPVWFWRPNCASIYLNALAPPHASNEASETKYAHTIFLNHEFQYRKPCMSRTMSTTPPNHEFQEECPQLRLKTETQQSKKAPQTRPLPASRLQKPGPQCKAAPK
jgi:hypothetical protein